MKKNKVTAMIGILMVLMLFATACSKMDSGSNNSAKTSPDIAKDEAKIAEYDSDMSTQNADQKIEEAPTADSADSSTDTSKEELTGSSALNMGTSAAVSQDKIIRTFNLEVETQEFDELITQINSQINRLEGYVESSEISGKRYYSSEQSRYGTIVARIPSKKVDEFVNRVDERANIVNKEESSKNVSLEYIDAESRVETLKIEQERLFAILEKEESLKNIITLESRLSEIRYELQNYESKLRYYDNQVAYSTIAMNIQEVEKLTPVSKEKQTVGMRIKNGFGDTMYQLSEGLKDFFVWFIVNLPYLLIWGAVLTVAVLMIRRWQKKQRSKRRDDATR